MGLLQLDTRPRDGSSTGRNSAKNVPRQETPDPRRISLVEKVIYTLRPSHLLFFPTAKLNDLFPLWLLEASSEISSHQEGQESLAHHLLTFGEEGQRFRSHPCHNLAVLLFLPQKPGEEW